MTHAQNITRSFFGLRRDQERATTSQTAKCDDDAQGDPASHSPARNEDASL